MPNVKMPTGLGLFLSPFIYSGGIKLYHSSYWILGEFMIVLWMLISLAVGLNYALNFRSAIFGFNSGTLLGYSPAITTIVFTLQVREYSLGKWLMDIFFVLFLTAGIATMLKKNKAIKLP